jgi:ABC transporter substrate binding protein
MPPAGSILERLNRVHLPAIYPWPDTARTRRPPIAEEGGFLGYGARLRVYFRQARLVSRILSGARPQNLPIEQPDRYDLAVNRKTAQTLGLTVPPSILARADEPQRYDELVVGDLFRRLCGDGDFVAPCFSTPCGVATSKTFAAFSRMALSRARSQSSPPRRRSWSANTSQPSAVSFVSATGPLQFLRLRSPHPRALNRPQLREQCDTS